MSDPDFQQFQRIFEHAVDLPAEERAKYLDEVCAGNEALRARVEELLAADAELEGFLEPPDGFGLPVNKLKEEATDFLPEEEIGGYQLLRELGRGGRGVVYLARNPKTDGLVALKVLGMGMLPSAVAVERFRREAKAVARLSHSGVVRLVKAGDDRTRPYLVMEYVEGHTLADEILLQRHAREGVELPEHLQGCESMLPTSEPARFDAAVKLVSQLSEALGHAHDRGVLHRDVKPQNILLDKQGKPYLVDFGLAFVEGEQELTRTGDVEGTPNYMSPEQVRAERDRIDLRTDVYSLGVVLYELLTLRRPFDAPTANQVMQNITRTMPPRIRRVAPSVPDALELLCTTAIEKRRRDRYASMASLKADLDAYLQQRPLQARRPGALTRAKRAVDRRPMPYFAAGAALLALVVGFALGDPVERWSALSAVESQLDELGEFDPAIDLRGLLARVEKLETRGWSLPASVEQRVDELLGKGLRLVEDELTSLVASETLTGALDVGYSALQLPTEYAGQPADWLESRRETWQRWGVSVEMLAEIKAELLGGGLVLEFPRFELEDSDQLELAEVRFPRNGDLAFRPATKRRFLPGYQLRDNALYEGRLRREGQAELQFHVIPVRDGGIRRLILGGGELPADLIDFPAYSATFGEGDAIPEDAQASATTAIAVVLDGSAGASFSLSSSYVSIADYFAFADATGARRATIYGDASTAAFQAIRHLPITEMRMDLAAAFAAWHGCRLPYLGETWVALGPFDSSGRPLSIPAEIFERMKTDELSFPSSAILDDPNGVSAFVAARLEGGIAANASPSVGPHPSGIQAWLHGLSECTVTRASPTLTPNTPGLDSGTFLWNGVMTSKDFLPVTSVSFHPMGAVHWNAAFRCARS